MNEKRSGLTGVRAWWLAIPGGVMLMALIALLAVTGVSARSFLNLSYNCGYYLLMAAAISVPFSRGHVDFSVFGTAAFSASIAGALCTYGGLAAAPAAIIAIFTGACIGVLNGLIAMPFRRKNPIFMAIGTLGINFFYIGISNSILRGQAMRFYGNFGKIRVSGISLLFILALFLVIGIAALLGFTGGGKRAFSMIYEKDEDRKANTIVSFLLSGTLASIAAVMQISRLGSVQPAAFSFNPIMLALLAGAGIALPNVKKSKAHAFLAYLSIIPAALAVMSLQTCLLYANIDSFITNAIFAVLAVIFMILNAVIGSKASKIEYVPAPKAAAAPKSSANISAADAYAATGKSKVAAILLAIFLGPIGVHRYYLGYSKQGAFQTIGFACIVGGIAIEGPALYKNTLGLLVPALILLLIGLGTSIWAFVDFIRIITGGLKPACDYVPATETRPTYVSEPVPTITPVEPAPVFTPAEEAPVAAPAEKTKPSASSQFGALAELANLYENGLISEEVYLKRKNEIISNL